MDFLNAIILLLNFTVLPALTYGSQLALGAIFVTLIYGVLRFANFATGDMMSFGTMFAVILTYYFSVLRFWIRCSTNSTFNNSFCYPNDDFIHVNHRQICFQLLQGKKKSSSSVCNGQCRGNVCHSSLN